MHSQQKWTKIQKALDINCWRIWIENTRYRKVVSKYIDHLPTRNNVNAGQDFSAIRSRLLGYIVDYSKENCKYYQRQFEAINYKDLSDFSKIPFLTKEIIREKLSDLLSKSVSHKSMWFTKTGGSTGNPMSFYGSGNADDIHQRFLFESYGYKPGDRILAMDSTTIDQELLDQDIYWKVKNMGSELPYGGMALSSSHLTEKNKNYYADFIREYKPDFIRGYPVFVADIANYMLKTKRSIDFAMKGIELTSEVVFDHHINTIKKAFKTEVLGQYGHHEGCVFGYTMDEGFDYYLSPLYGFSEILDPEGNHVKPEEEGEVVVTGFANFGMPFIRYKTGDRAIYGGEKNGVIRLKKVSGRIMDYIVDREGQKILVSYRFLGPNSVYHISEWQIIQDEPGVISLNVRRLPSYKVQHEKEIIATFKKHSGIDCNIQYDKTFSKAQNGKTRFIIQNVL